MNQYKILKYYLYHYYYIVYVTVYIKILVMMCVTMYPCIHDGRDKNTNFYILNTQLKQRAELNTYQIYIRRFDAK